MAGRARTTLIAGALALAGAVTIVWIVATPMPPAVDQEEGALATPQPAEPEVVVTFAGLDLGAGDYVVSAYVAGIIDLGGTCTVQAALGEGMLTATSAATPNVADTQCEELRIPAEALTPGEWKVTVGYSGPSGNLLSAPVPLDVLPPEETS